jgi:anaerobic ribonucleoside-triphosphate reductase
MNYETICPCCGEHKFSVSNNYEVCPICKWRDDLLQRVEPDTKGANVLTLNQLLRTFKKI